MEIGNTPKGRVTLTCKDESQARKVTLQWELRPDLGYAVSSFRVVAQAQTKPQEEIIADDFRSVEGVMLPYSLRISASLEGPQVVSATERMTITEYKIRDPGNTEVRYHIQWPEGTKLFDYRNGAYVQYPVGADGQWTYIFDMNLVKFRELARAAATQPSTLKGGTFAAPVTGLVVNPNRRNNSASTVDLDSAKVVDLPPLDIVQNPQTEEERKQAADAILKQRQQIKDRGIDLSISYSPNARPDMAGWGIDGLDLLLFKIPADAWKKPQVSSVEAAISGTDPGVRVAVISTKVAYMLGMQPDLPTVFAYRTREGGTGMMRITEFQPGRVIIDVMRIVPPSSPNKER